jgi:tRNA (mo5U34)-methyltransferase
MAAVPSPRPESHVTSESQFWYHRIPMPDGTETPGWAPLAPEAYRIPEDLTGKRVLDVGAWDGYWSLEAIRRGAREVVAIDDFSDFLGTPEAVGRRAWDTFDFVRSAWGIDASRMQRMELDLYQATEDRVGVFDVVFCFGVLYHLRHPLLALDIMSSICRDEICIETAICDDFSVYNGGFGKGYSGAQPVMEFYPNDEYGNNPTNWWCPSLSCLGLMMISAGWLDVEAWKLTQNPEQLAHCRGFARGSKPGAQGQA